MVSHGLQVPIEEILKGVPPSSILNYLFITLNALGVQIADPALRAKFTIPQVRSTPTPSPKPSAFDTFMQLPRETRLADLNFQMSLVLSAIVEKNYTQLRAILGEMLEQGHEISATSWVAIIHGLARRIPSSHYTQVRLA